jgi:hypothetical protein
MSETSIFFLAFIAVGVSIAIVAVALFGKRDIDIEFLGITVRLKK